MIFTLLITIMALSSYAFVGWCCYDSGYDNGWNDYYQKVHK